MCYVCMDVYHLNIMVIQTYVVFLTIISIVLYLLDKMYLSNNDVQASLEMDDAVFESTLEDIMTQEVQQDKPQVRG